MSRAILTPPYYPLRESDKHVDCQNQERDHDDFVGPILWANPPPDSSYYLNEALKAYGAMPLNRSLDEAVARLHIRRLLRHHSAEDGVLLADLTALLLSAWNSTPPSIESSQGVDASLVEDLGADH